MSSLRGSCTLLRVRVEGTRIQDARVVLPLSQNRPLILFPLKIIRTTRVGYTVIGYVQEIPPPENVIFL